MLRGWLQRSNDLEVCLYAAKTLCNMDTDDPNHQAVQDLYILAPDHRTR